MATAGGRGSVSPKGANEVVHFHAATTANKEPMYVASNPAALHFRFAIGGDVGNDTADDALRQVVVEHQVDNLALERTAQAMASSTQTIDDRDAYTDDLAADCHLPRPASLIKVADRYAQPPFRKVDDNTRERINNDEPFDEHAVDTKLEADEKHNGFCFSEKGRQPTKLARIRIISVD